MCYEQTVIPTLVPPNANDCPRFRYGFLDDDINVPCEYIIEVNVKWYMCDNIFNNTHLTASF